jgi:hypothetical protein
MTVNNALTKLKDYARNQNLDSSRGIRAIDSASAFVLNHLGVHGYENEMKFDYIEDQNIYTLATAVGEPISLRYDDDLYNKPQRRFIRKPPEYLFERIDNIQADTLLYGTYTAAAANQLIVLAKNTMAILALFSFDSGNSTKWTASLDATNITDDLYIFKEGSGSMSFDVSAGLSVSNRATLTGTSSAFDLEQYAQVGHFKMWVYLPNITNLTSISLTWGSDSANYFKQTVTTQDDGSAFAVDWNKLDFDWDGATQIGTPDVNNIDYWVIDLDYTAAYTGGLAYRIDYLKEIGRAHV